MSHIDDVTTTASVGDAAATPALVARKLSLGISGARVGDAVRPVRASDPYASTTGVPRRGLRVHARGTTPPSITTAMTPTATAASMPTAAAPATNAAEAVDEPYPWEVSS